MAAGVQEPFEEVAVGLRVAACEGDDLVVSVGGRGGV